MSIPQEAYRALEAIVGPEYISRDPVTCRAYNAKSYRSETAYKRICTLPACVILPRTTDEVQRDRFAAANTHDFGRKSRAPKNRTVYHENRTWKRNGDAMAASCLAVQAGRVGSESGEPTLSETRS